MADYKSRNQSDTRAAGTLTSSRWAHIDGSVTTPIVVRSTAGRLKAVTLNTNGATVTVKNGSEVVAIIATDAPEQTFQYGIWCNNNIVVVAGGVVDATILFDE